MAATEARRRLAVTLHVTLPERDVSAILPSTTRACRPRGPAASLFILLLQIPFPVVLAVQSVKAARSHFPNSKMEDQFFDPARMYLRRKRNLGGRCWGPRSDPPRHQLLESARYFFFWLPEVGSFLKLYINPSERTSSCDKVQFRPKDYIEANRDEMSQQGNKRTDCCADSQEIRLSGL
ncbi:hypothetical protein EJB05_03038, partial [Eragrostis curvula]